WDRTVPRTAPLSSRLVDLRTSETAGALRMEARYITLTLDKRGLLAHVADAGGAPVLDDASEPSRDGPLLTLDRMAPPRVRYYGLGPREDSAVDLRGHRVSALRPFLISSYGYGEMHEAPGDYVFDMAAAQPDRYRIESRAGAIDYYFLYGPSPKEIYEQL